MFWFLFCWWRKFVFRFWLVLKICRIKIYFLNKILSKKKVFFINLITILLTKLNKHSSINLHVHLPGLTRSLATIICRFCFVDYNNLAANCAYFAGPTPGSSCHNLNILSILLIIIIQRKDVQIYRAPPGLTAIIWTYVDFVDYNNLAADCAHFAGTLPGVWLQFVYILSILSIIIRRQIVCILSGLTPGLAASYVDFAGPPIKVKNIGKEYNKI